jgi:hypothetical protein
MQNQSQTSNLEQVVDMNARANQNNSQWHENMLNQKVRGTSAITNYTS